MIAIITGSGFKKTKIFNQLELYDIKTPYGKTSSKICYGNLFDKKVFILARHGNEHNFPPHNINYRANIWALKSLNVDKIIAIATVGGINDKYAPGLIAIPSQILDYTYGRNHTFFDDFNSEIKHIDFTIPYCAKLRNSIVSSIKKKEEIDFIPSGVYAATQGPRLETAAEILKYRNDGADIVGMTGMPEASLAKELSISYSSICLIVNWAAGINDNSNSIDIHEIAKFQKKAMLKVYDSLKIILNEIQK